MSRVPIWWTEGTARFNVHAEALRAHFTQAMQDAYNDHAHDVMSTVTVAVRNGSLVRQTRDLMRGRLVEWGCWIPPERSIGRGENERVIEVPLAASIVRWDRPGAILDAGAVLNSFREAMPDTTRSSVHLINTLTNEHIALEGRTARSYVQADLRDLRMFADGAFETTVC